MPGSTMLFQTDQDEEESKDSEVCLAKTKQPPPVAPRTTSVSLQSWQSATTATDTYGDSKHARSSSMDSLESSGSSSSSGGYNSSNHRVSDVGIGEYIPTRNASKIAKLPSHNPLQFVKVQSPLYMKVCKAEQQINVTKEVKISREAIKEGEEEWQSNLDNWKSRRRKATEKVIQRAEEMRQIEAEEQLRNEQALLQQRKIKKFSEIVERRSSRSYNLDLYIGQGDDSGLGGTPEPDDVIDNQNSILRSDTSEGMTSEAESIDSDTQKSDKIHDKEAPDVPQKPQAWLKRHSYANSSSSHSFLSEITDKEIHAFDSNSSTEPSDIEAHVCDSETISSEEDVSFGDHHKSENYEENSSFISETNDVISENTFNTLEQDSGSSITQSEEVNNKSDTSLTTQIQLNCQKFSYKIHTKPGDSKGFGFYVKGGKDIECTPFVESVSMDGPAYAIGLRDGDEIVSLNGEPASTYSHASLIFTIKQAIYTGVLDIEVSRHIDNDLKDRASKPIGKKSSFAEKLAMFSSGTNSSIDKIKSPQDFTKQESKKESLVLRRRSAFETNVSENVTQRRASCLLQETVHESFDIPEKRRSVDFSLQSNTKKKEAPPPVPAKPKVKTKPILETINNYKCDNLPQINNCDVNHTLQYSDVSTSSSIKDLSVKNTFDSNKSSRLDNLNNTNNTRDLPVSDEQGQNSQIKFKEIGNINNEDIDNIRSRESSIFNETKSEINDQSILSNDLGDVPLDIDNEKLNICFDSSISVSEQISVSDSISEQISVSDSISEQISVIDSISEQISASNNLSNSIEELSFQSKVDNESNKQIISNHEKSLDDISTSEINGDFVAQEEIHSSKPFEEIYDFDSKETSDLNYVNDIIDSPLEVIENNSAIMIDNTQTEDPPTVDNLSENANVMNLNSSPLCLSLEKTDEDDVISASTTTSSETPDTETVIETLPLNLSPLPSDESNGEDMSKLSLKDQQSEVEIVQDSIEVSTNSSILKCVPNQKDSSDSINQGENISDYNNYERDDNLHDLPNDVFTDEQDEEYQRELDESLDQITALDVIDEIEHRLMQQLENQDENFEEINDGLTFQLENDLNQDWIYYSEVDLLEDYTPQNREPPKEPPPPPPIESEIDEEVKPLTRVNSTKRIKKELWRRRSDFLGLDSSEGIDVDNILPPPPGLEEILKLEHEQNQWLEKRLSLAETDLSDTLSMKSNCLDTKDFSLDYSTSYMHGIEEYDSKPSFDVSKDNWQEKLAEHMYEIEDFPSSSDVPPPVPEESVKPKESPQNKAKQMINNLGAAPKAKIMDSNKWITEKISPISKRVSEPLFRQASYDQNYWVAQDAGRKRNLQSDVPNRRYSMTSHPSNHPDVTLRTWDDRENEFQKQRPRSTVWNPSSNSDILYDSHQCVRQDVLRNLNDEDEISCDIDVLESEMHQCSCCGKGLCEGSAMGIEALRLYFHIECFRCCVCQMLLGNGTSGTDVQVKNNQLYCPNCFTVD